MVGNGIGWMIIVLNQIQKSMCKIIIILYILLCNVTYGQECSPFYKPKSYTLDKNKSAAIGYVACLHARGVVAEVGYDKLFLGILAMGQRHHGATYTFLQYEVPFDRFRVYIGPAYKLNHDPRLIIGRVGLDLKLYKKFYATGSILQINQNLNYLHVGFKVLI